MFRPLPEKLRLVGTISPSKAHNLLSEEGCKFRLVLSSQQDMRGLPLNQQAAIGNMTHRLYEYAKSSNREWRGAETEWNEIAREKNIELGRDVPLDGGVPLDAGLKPVEHYADYDIWSMDAMDYAEELRQSLDEGRVSEESERARGCFGPEVKVWWTDNGVITEWGDATIRGKIDLVEYDGERLIITDYKRKIYLEDEEIKPEYVTQLSIYSALLHSRLQVAGYEDWFPDETRLVELFTPNEEVLPIDRKLAMESIDRLLDITNDINIGIIREGQEHALQLANPGIETCRFCEFRPSCQPYLDELKGWMAEGVTEIYDVIGELKTEPSEHIRHSPTGGVLIEDEDGQRWRVSGIELEAERHRDTLEAVECGQIVGVFNCYNVAETLPDMGYNFKAKARNTNHVFYAYNPE